MINSTITITYGENVENHRGNQQIGMRAIKGLSNKNIADLHEKFSLLEYDNELINLRCEMLDEVDYADCEDAKILIVRNFVQKFCEKPNDLCEILTKLDWDKKFLNYGKVMNKKARYNLCFADFDQEPDYTVGKGRVYDFKNFDFMVKIRTFLEEITGVKLNAEGNYYYDTKKCYIGYHGDTERKIVIGIRFGATFPLHYQWHIGKEKIGKKYTIELNNGDMYFMSEKASGFDWKRKKIMTLRHAAGFKL